ncbi:MAG: magnesium transporter [Candidatus Marinimicrobia bacterium]|jgi:magnesium transporter|nr:magnesium transporter [Candidatus Neomarinimicrobiota bacterium]MBT3675456.1 magnesium transporter [Candidatus Neomarinimicrobiota bacterium]MBT3762568.1 magnesium transporter [Candidatus Neomarinimicrobiota bacterium]MBT4067786.1 magnesium transporter [Candidatus Neomarinimicrobiota bacterium]MBT4271633.1 magnesium transporter [Candidatus Neomarinimicrobiota bacterium]
MKKEMFGSEITLMRDTFRRLLRRHAKTNIIKLIERTHPADMALIFRYFNDGEQDTIFGYMTPTEETVEFLGELDESIVVRLLEQDEPSRIASILEEASSNEQAYLMGLVEEEYSTAVIDLLQAEEQEELEEMMAYPEDSAGILMYTDIFTLHEETKARDAIVALQDQEDAEMVFYLYALDDDGRLNGVVSLRDLVTTPGDAMLKDIMSRKVHAVRPETDQEEVARIVSQYNFLAVPVVDDDEQLLGIVTVDEVVDIIREEATEDFLQMVGAGKDREILLKSSWENARMRLPWLFASWVGGIGAAFIIGIFNNILESTIALAAFIPVIMGMGGNIGTQSSTIIVRGLATGRVGFENSTKILFKEIRVGLILGILYGILLGLFAIFRFLDASPMLGVVVGLSICFSMIIAATIGSMVPLILNRFDIDPAIATGPFVTTAIDILGVTLYFLIAGSLLVIT